MADEINQKEQDSFERVRPGDTVTLVAGDRSTQITVGVRARASAWLKQKAKSVWDRMSPENFLFFYLSRWDKDPAEAVHRSCAYYLSSFGGVPAHILTSQDCEDFYASLSDKLKAEIDRAHANENSDDPTLKAEAQAVLDTLKTATEWDSDADTDLPVDDADDNSPSSIYE